MKLISRIVITFSVMLIGISFSYGASNVLINPPSEWIKIADPSLSSDIHPDAKDSHYLLYDRQVNATSVKEQYFRMAYRLLNETSVEENGQQYFDFSPDYQTLIFHSLRVIRDGEIINKLSKEQIKIIQREQDAEKLMLDGRLSAYIILDDLRKNDIIDYSYTIKGSNPALNNLFYSYVQLEWATPIDELNYRLLWPKNETLNYKPVSTQLSPKIIEGEKYTEYSIRDTHTNAVHIDDQSPYWFDPRGRITFSNQSSWGDIVDWALPLYEPATNANLENIVADIKKQSNSQEGQLSLALQFVQNEIRYLGIEIGEGSFIPSDINTTLDKRYADCKGKVLLLLSLMKALNIEGYAALVNSYITNELSIDGIRATAFNHVIIKAVVNNKFYWLDPTKSNQLPDINVLFQPDYGHALVIKKEVNALEKMNTNRLNKKIIHEKIDTSSGLKDPTDFNIQTNYFGLSSELLRQDLESNTIKQLQSSYLNFYNRFYPGIKSNSDMVVIENSDNHSIKTIENYTLIEAWKKKDNQYEIDFYANSISQYLDKPTTTIRNSPYELLHPVDITHIIEVKLHGSNWGISDESYHNDSDFFDFSRDITFDNENNTLIQTYRYKSTKNYVPSNKIDTYLQDLDDAIYRNSYGLYSTFNDTSLQPSDLSLQDIVILILIFSVIAIIFSIISLSREKEVFNSDDQFYPVSMIKFSTLSFLTFGIYISYWFYKNWQYVKRDEASKIMPLGRAIFVMFWFYPLLARLNKKSNNDTLSNRLFAILLAVMFTVGIVITNSSNMMIIFIGISLEIASALYLVNTINNLNSKQKDTLERNSKWRTRHAISGVPLAFITFFIIASDIALIPPNYVFSGDMLWRHDIQFLQRHGILNLDEEIEQFFSSDFISFEKDGNAITDKRVFSYWKDSDGTIYNQSATFKEVAKIDVKDGSSIDNTTVKVNRHDGSSFILFLSTENGGDKTFINLLRERTNISNTTEK